MTDFDWNSFDELDDAELNDINGGCWGLCAALAPLIVAYCVWRWKKKVK